MKTFKTPKGTELPLLNLKGKHYLAVQTRLVWFREEKPLWGIETEPLEMGPGYAVFKATIKDETGRIIAQGTKAETKEGFSDFHEKAESGAIGRALGFLGYGTLFATELDEGDRLADSPQSPKTPIEKLRAGESFFAPKGAQIIGPVGIEPPPPINNDEDIYNSSLTIDPFRDPQPPTSKPGYADFPKCEKCGSKMTKGKFPNKITGEYDFYCVPCWKDKKPKK